MNIPEVTVAVVGLALIIASRPKPQKPQSRIEWHKPSDSGSLRSVVKQDSLKGETDDE